MSSLRKNGSNAGELNNNDYGSMGSALNNVNANGLPYSESAGNLTRQRSMSFSAISVSSQSINQNNDNGLPMSHQDITAPGGFRRSFIVRKHTLENKSAPYLPNFIRTNFNEFLRLYGHFAGEDLSEEEEEEEGEGEEEEEETLEETRRRLLEGIRAEASGKHKASTTKAILLLLKSFVGTGILFLPKGFSNGGYMFSTISLFLCSILSYYCFILLISTKDQSHGIKGYGDLGNHIYGKGMKISILLSIALSQIGFGAAYTVFTATNLKALCGMVADNTVFTVTIFIVLQTFLFIPLSFTRNIAKLTALALIADLFILIGLMYLYYYPAKYIAQHGVAWDTMVSFNSNDWSLFIGTAIFTFEGIGLLIPIQESMAVPQNFKLSLSLVMVIVTVIFISIGFLCYAAFGSNVKTVVFENFPQDSSYTLVVQLLYSLAILLSTPLQLFPAIRILENWVFTKNASGKYNPKIKWAKNYFRTFVVIGTTFIAWVGAADLDKFVSLVGSFACIPLIYVYPPLLHYKASRMEGTGSPFILGLDLIIVCFGLCIMGYTSWQTILMWIN